MGRSSSTLARAALLASLTLVVSCGESPRQTDSSDAPAAITSKIESALEPYLEPEGPVRAVIVQVDGERVLENYYDSSRNEYRDIYSVTKSVMSTLVGIAIDEGLIAGVDSTLAELLPSYAATMEQPVADTTLDEVLTMSAGFPGGGLEDWTFETSADPVRAILNNAVRAPGEEWDYSNATAQLVSAILEAATGIPTLEYARTRLFEPLGIPSSPSPRVVLPEGLDTYHDADFAWPVDHAGLALGWARLRLRPVDLVSLGQLFLQRGLWEGTQIVSEAWADQAVRDQVPELNVSPAPNSYGYFWWTTQPGGEPGYAAIGYGGQRIEVVPEKDLVVVISTHADEVDPEDFGITDTHAEQIVDAITGAL